jgi:single-strand DNA-binding protein
MNNVQLIGRLTRDPEVRYTASGMAVASFAVAIDRPTKQGEEKKADFPRITVFGRQAENCEKYLVKGRKVAIEGRIQTGSYQDKEGRTVYTTDVVANRVEFLKWGDQQQAPAGDYQQQAQTGSYQAATQSFQTREYPQQEVPPNFEMVQEEVPF